MWLGKLVKSIKISATQRIMISQCFHSLIQPLVLSFYRRVNRCFNTLFC